MLPFPEMPYGPAPGWVFPLFEISIAGLFILCLRDALKRGRGAAAYLLGGTAFGLLLEYLEVISHSYTYGRFWMMLGRAPLDIPVSVGLAWGIILYSSRLFSDALRFPWVAAAALDTLLALNIDLTMDVVAYRLHLWHWDWSGSGLDPLKAQWFGVPYGNFVGWISVVFFYSFFSRLFERTLFRCGKSRWVVLGAVLALVAAQGELLVTESFVFPWLRTIGITSGWRLLLEIMALSSLAVWGSLHRRGRGARKISSLSLWVSGWFHVFFVAAFLACGFFRENWWMTLIAVGNATLGLVLHLLPQRRAGERILESSAAWAEVA